MTRSGKFLLTAWLSWFALALAIGLTGIFKQASAPVVALTVWALTAVLLLAWWKIAAINRWASDIDLSWLIALHLSRFVGVYFLLLCRNDSLSCAFATPAG